MIKRVLIAFTFMFLAFVSGQAQEAGLVVESFTEMFGDTDGVDYPVLDQNGKKCAIIKVKNENKGFDFSVGTLGVHKVDENHDGETWVYVPEGVRKITISHEQFGVLRDWPIPIPVYSAGVYELNLVNGTLKIVIDKSFVETEYVAIDSDPQGAEVYLDGKNVGRTPFISRYKVGVNMEWRLKKRLYHDEIGLLKVGTETDNIFVSLRPEYGSFKISSSPAGAVVYLDDETESRGTTPCEISMVASGKHTVFLEAPRYSNTSVEVIVEDGGFTEKVVAMRPIFAEVSIVSQPEAEIDIQGLSTSAQGLGVWNGMLKEGTYTVNASRTGYKHETREIFVKNGEFQEININLEPLYGKVSFSSNPAGASIVVNGEMRGYTPDMIELPVREYSYTLSKDGCADETGTFVVEEDKETHVDVALRTGVNVQIITGANGDIVYIDGQNAGTSPLQVILPYGSHTAYARRGGKKTVAKTFELSTSQKTLDVNLSFTAPVVIGLARNNTYYGINVDGRSVEHKDLPVIMELGYGRHKVKVKYTKYWNHFTVRQPKRFPKVIAIEDYVADFQGGVDFGVDLRGQKRGALFDANFGWRFGQGFYMGFEEGFHALFDYDTYSVIEHFSEESPAEGLRYDRYSIGNGEGFIKSGVVLTGMDFRWYIPIFAFHNIWSYLGGSLGGWFGIMDAREKMGPYINGSAGLEFGMFSISGGIRMLFNLHKSRISPVERILFADGYEEYTEGSGKNYQYMSRHVGQHFSAMPNYLWYIRVGLRFGN